MILNPKYQELNIPGVRKLKGGEFISENIISKLKTEKNYDKFKEYFISDVDYEKSIEEKEKKKESLKKNEEVKNKGKNEFIN
jgi:hypothetical protein